MHAGTWVLVLGVPSHKIGRSLGKPELARKSGMRVLGSLGCGGREPHAQLVHHARTQAVLRAEGHAHGSTLKFKKSKKNKILDSALSIYLHK